jgi:UDP-N-acetylglucosamine 1-carboxyvinyltransferase
LKGKSLDKLVINGGRPLNGSVEISGSKNAVLALMAATILADGEYRIDRVPDLRDVHTMSNLLRILGLEVEFSDHTLTIRNTGCKSFEAPYDLVKTMRASIYVLGPLVGRYGKGRASLPGGCAWGPRPVNLHIEGLKKLGAEIHLDQGYITAAAGRLAGTRIVFDVSSVGATANLLLASVLAQGVTSIENAAKEPEIDALANYLVQMGANINGIGTDRLEIEGVDKLHPADVTVIPDRIETATFLIAGLITGGDITLNHTEPEHLKAVIAKLEDSGAKIETGLATVRLQSDGPIKPVDVTTSIYPGFPTDAQAQWMALMCLANGASVITDTVFEDRFTHVAELMRFGADIVLDHNVAVVRGVPRLSSAQVMSTDLRASASLILAGLAAEGRTDVSRIYHIDRGYERIETKLKALGAEIRRDREKMVV